MSGSIAMSAMAALRAGAGLVTVAVPSSCLELVASFHPSFMTFPLTDDGTGQFGVDSGKTFSKVLERAEVIGCGPGLSTNSGAVSIVEQVLRVTSRPRVLDADALNILGRHRDQIELNQLLEILKPSGTLILTPHPREMERITGVKSSDRPGQIAIAETLSKHADLVWVLKGGPTVVVADGTQWVNTTGNPGMATAGSGDVLTGVIASLLGQGLSAWDAARLGVWVHGLSGDLAAKQHGQIGLIATDLIDSLPTAIEMAVAR